MVDTLNKLISLLDLERLDNETFRAASLDIGTGRVYGGQVLGQALKAAQMTIDGSKIIHSMHAYFLRLGDFKAPIIYKVDISRNGRSFSTRRVVAIQHDQPIFITAASFQLEEEGLDYQPSMPDVIGPESLQSLADYTAEKRKQLADKLHSVLKLSAPFDLRPAETTQVENPAPEDARSYIWVKTRHPIADDPNLHRAILAYISDYGLLSAALIPHKLDSGTPSLQLASIDHGMWFHRPFRVDEWLLYCCEPMTNSNSRGLARGSFYSRDGRLIASTAQEGLIRRIKNKNLA